MYSVRHPARRYDREYIAYPISVFSLCVACSICRCGSGGRHGGFCFFSFPAVSMISCPHPPFPPSPSGEGGCLKVYFAGGFAPGTPALNRLRHLLKLPCRCPAGGLPGRSPGRPALSFICCPHPPRPPSPSGEGGVSKFISPGASPPAPLALNRLRHLQTPPCRSPAGGLPGRSPARPALSFIGCPHPPAPLPVGKGAFSFLMQGASPLASPRPSRKRHGLHLRCGCPAGGGLPGRSPGRPVFSFISCPHPPAPLPGGKGESQSLFRRGLRPRHPCTESPTALADAAMQEPGGCTPAAPLAGNLFLSVLRRTIGSAPGDARGGAPCIR